LFVNESPLVIEIYKPDYTKNVETKTHYYNSRNERVWFTEELIDGVRHGTVKFYDFYEQTVSDEIKYNYGVKTNYTKYHTSGNLKEENTYNDKGILIKSINYSSSSGNVSSTYEYYDDGNDKISYRYDDNGKIKSYNEYNENKGKIKYISYTNGILEEIRLYDYDEHNNQILNLEYDSQGVLIYRRSEIASKDDVSITIKHGINIYVPSDKEYVRITNYNLGVRIDSSEISYQEYLDNYQQYRIDVNEI